MDAIGSEPKVRGLKVKDLAPTDKFHNLKAQLRTDRKTDHKHERGIYYTNEQNTERKLNSEMHADSNAELNAELDEIITI